MLNTNSHILKISASHFLKCIKKHAGIEGQKLHSRPSASSTYSRTEHKMEIQNEKIVKDFI